MSRKQANVREQKQKQVMCLSRFLALLIVIYLVYGFSLAVMSHTGFPKDMQSGLFFPYLADKPIGEDGYYMLTVAWNLANGHGIVYNYDQPTVGIQPLSTFIYAGLAGVTKLLGGDKWVFTRLVLVFGTINLLLFAHIVGTLTCVLAKSRGPSRELEYAFGFIGATFNFGLWRLFTYGLETGIYMTLLATCILYTLNFSRNDKPMLREAITLGVLSGMTSWARLDFSVVLLVFFAISIFRHQLRLSQVMIAGTITTLIVCPWFLYTFFVTGSWIPSSGIAQAGLITAKDTPPWWPSASMRMRIMAHAIVSHLTPWIYSDVNVNEFFVPGELAFLSFIAFSVLVLRAKNVRTLLILKIKQWPYFANWFAGTLALVLIYPIIFWATHFYRRYSAPISIFIIPIMAIAVSERIQTMSKTLRFILVALPMCFFVWALLSLHTGRIGNTHAVTAGFIHDHFSSVKVGAFQSGVVGFFNANVINLGWQSESFSALFK